MSAERDEADRECSHQLHGHEVYNVKKISFLNETQYIYGPSLENDMIAVWRRRVARHVQELWTWASKHSCEVDEEREGRMEAS